MTTTDVGGGKPKYFTKLAVSFRTNHPQPWAEKNLMDCLNYRIQPNRNAPMPIVICRLHKKHENNSEFYVESRTPDDLKKLLALDKKKVMSYGIQMWPTVEPWDLHQSKEGSSRFNCHSKQEKKQNYYGPSHQDHSERKDCETDANARPSKRPRVEIESPSSKTNIMNMEKKMSDKTNSNSNGGSSSSSACKVHLIKHPSCTPKYFLDYLNNHIKQTKMSGVSDGASGQPPILTCIPNTGDGWMLETQTPKIVDSIINHLSGKLVLLGTRLYFQRKSNILIPPQSPSSKRRLSRSESPIRPRPPPPLPNWSHDECKVFFYSAEKVSHFELQDFFNSFMRKAGLYDYDVVLESRTIYKNDRLSVYLCISVEAAQSIIEELNNISFNGMTLKLKRHNLFQKHAGGTARDISEDNSKTVEETKRKVTSPSNTETQPEPSPKKPASPANTAKPVTKDPKIVVVPSNMSRRGSIETVPRKAVAARQGSRNNASKFSTAISSCSESSTDSIPAAETETAKLKAMNESLKKKLMKLLKENKDLKRQNEKLTKEASSGSHEEPIVLADSGDENDMKQKYNDISSQLDELKAEKAKRDLEFVDIEDARDKFKTQLEKAKADISQDYERRLHDIHESWREQKTEIEEQQELIKQLKEGLEERTTQKQELEATMKEKDAKFDTMTDALMKATSLYHEERATRNVMAESLVRFRKEKKKAEKELKRHLTRVKEEDKYDA